MKRSLFFRLTIFFVFFFFQINCLSVPKSGWESVPEILTQIKAAEFPKRDFNIVDFGAVGNGRTDCTESFKRAIEECNNAGGGRVIVPEGTFLTGAIHLKSNVNLFVSEGATLLFDQNPQKYLPLVYTRWEGVECKNYSAFIYAFEQENIAITGKGILNGNAGEEVWWPWKGRRGPFGGNNDQPNQGPARLKLFEMAEQNVPVEDRIMGEGAYLRPNFIQPYRCKNILIEGVTIINSPMWEINPVLCENVIIRGIHISSHGPNNDGCDPECCKNVLIEDCYFDTGDDCIALKSGRNTDGRRVNKPIENVIIRNCQMKDGHGGVVIGSEISGGAKNIFAEDCIMDSPNLDRALRIKTNSVRGGVIENIFFRNVKVGQVGDAIVLVNFYYEEGDAAEFKPSVRNIQIENVMSEKSRYGLRLLGYPESPVTDINLKNCDFKNVADGNVFFNVKNIETDNVKFNGELLQGIEENLTPEAVLSTLNREINNGIVERASEVERNGDRYYQFQLLIDGNRKNLRISPRGDLLK
jgi:polygalacturonase